MTGAITFSLVLLLIWWRVVKHYRKQDEKRRLLEKDLEDETLFVQGVGKVNFEDLGEIATADPDAYITRSVTNSFEEEAEEEHQPELPIKDLPLTEERRASIDEALLYLLELFGKDIVHAKPMITPEDTRFPEAIHHPSEIIPLAHSIARIMDIDPAELEIGFFEAGIREFDQNTGDTIYWSREDYAGLYHGRNEQGKFVVSISDDIHHETDRLITAIAHEFSHIKLLGEKRIEENNEELTDMLPLLYGLGIFSANTRFKFDAHARGWTHSNLGYLSQVDWGYLFALYRVLRAEENETPEWFRYLNKTIARDCDRSLAFIKQNEEKVLVKRG